MLAVVGFGVTVGVILLVLMILRAKRRNGEIYVNSYVKVFVNVPMDINVRV